MNDIVDQLLVKLKIISKIRSNEKVEINNDKISLQDINFYNSLIRYIRGDSRDKTISYISDIINNSIDVLLTFINSNHLQNAIQNKNKHINDDNISNNSKYEFMKCYTSLLNLATELKNSLEGLENLRTTYQDDVHTASKIEVIMNKITTHTRLADETLNKVTKLIEK